MYTEPQPLLLHPDIARTVIIASLSLAVLAILWAYYQAHVARRALKSADHLAELVRLSGHGLTGDLKRVAELQLRTEEALSMPVLGWSFVIGAPLPTSLMPQVRGETVAIVETVEEANRAIVERDSVAKRLEQTVVESEVRVREAGALLLQQLEAEIPRFQRAMTKHLTERETALKRDLVQAVNEVRKALILSQEELRKNPAYADIVTRFTALDRFLEQLDLGVDLDSDDLREMIKTTIFAQVEKDHGVKLGPNGRRR